MQDTEHAVAGEWRRARVTAALLREQLTSAGILPAEDAARLDVRRDLGGRAYVHIPDLPVDDADRLLAVITGRQVETGAAS